MKYLKGDTAMFMFISRKKQLSAITVQFMSFGDPYSNMEQMDEEIAHTKVGQSFSGNLRNNKNDQNVNNETDEKLNLVENLLNSFEQQQGQPGPVSSLLGSLNINLPPNSDRFCASDEEKE